MRKSKDTTTRDYVNRNQQVNLGYDNPNGTDNFQKVYRLRCERLLPDGRKCDATYGANGSDIWQRKCPTCQGGKKGLRLLSDVR